MRVLQVLYSGLGGHASVAFALVAGGAQEGSWRHSFVFVGVEPLLPAYEEACRSAGIPYSYVSTEAGRPWRSWPRLYAALKRHEPDAIILHSVSSLPPCYLYSQMHRRKLVCVEHTPVHLKTRRERLISQLAMRVARRVVLLTKEYERDHAEACGRYYDARRVITIPNGIDVVRFAPTGARHTEGVVRLGMAARFSGQKRQCLLVECLDWLRQSHPETSWHLTLAGGGERIAQVRSEVSRSGLEDQVEFCGSLDQEDLATWFQTLDVYVHASDGETLSISLLQAMAAGVPIVASRVPGIANLLEPEGLRLGTLVAQNDPVVFGQAIAAVQGDPASAERMAAGARTYALERHSQEAMFRAYDGVLRDC